MNEKDDSKFVFKGLPANEEFEVEDDDEKETFSQDKLPGHMKKIKINLNDLFKDIPDDLKDAIVNDKSGPAVDAAIEKYVEQLAKEMFKTMGSIVENNFGDGDDIESLLSPEALNDDEEVPSKTTQQDNKEKKRPYELGSKDYLLKTENFKQIPCLVDPDIYQKFVAKFGESNITLDSFPNNIDVFSKITIPLSKLTSFKIVDSTDMYVLLYGSGPDDSTYGAFIAVIEGENGEFEIVCPCYGNTVDTINGDLFNINKNPELFDPSGKFKFLSLDKIRAGLELTLVPIRNPLISPTKFGSIKQTMSNIDLDGSSQWLRVGMIESNEFSDAILLKRDFDLPKNQKIFPFYFKFTEPVDGEILEILADLINRVNLNESLLMHESELKVKSDKLYIDIDLSTLTNNLFNWWPDEGNAE